jgi:hypothetical protein
MRHVKPNNGGPVKPSELFEQGIRVKQEGDKRVCGNLSWSTDSGGAVAMDKAYMPSGALAESVIFLRRFSGLPDPRQRGKMMYPLDETLLLCPANFTTLKHTAVNLTRRAPGKDSLRLKRKVAARNDDFVIVKLV